MSTREQGTYLRFFVHENRKHNGKLLFEWLLEQAKTLGAPRGTAFRAIADFGRRKVMHEQQFFELAGEITVRVDFLVTDAERDQLLQMVEAEKLKIPYALFPVEFGITEGDH
jgi:PII-like signaling protein